MVRLETGDGLGVSMLWTGDVTTHLLYSTDGEGQQVTASTAQPLGLLPSRI